MTDILENYWVEYLRYWNTSVKDVSHPPNVDDFWLWYAKFVLDKKDPQYGGVR